MCVGLGLDTMKRINKLLGIEEQESLWYPQDVNLLRYTIPELALVSDIKIQELYSEYSDMFAAGWMMLDDDRIEDFQR